MSCNCTIKVGWIRDTTQQPVLPLDYSVDIVKVNSLVPLNVTLLSTINQSSSMAPNPNVTYAITNANPSASPPNTPWSNIRSNIDQGNLRNPSQIQTGTLNPTPVSAITSNALISTCDPQKHGEYSYLISAKHGNVLVRRLNTNYAKRLTYINTRLKIQNIVNEVQVIQELELISVYYRTDYITFTIASEDTSINFTINGRLVVIPYNGNTINYNAAVQYAFSTPSSNTYTVNLQHQHASSYDNSNTAYSQTLYYVIVFDEVILRKTGIPVNQANKYLRVNEYGILSYVHDGAINNGLSFSYTVTTTNPTLTYIYSGSNQNAKLRLLWNNTQLSRTGGTGTYNYNIRMQTRILNGSNNSTIKQNSYTITNVPLGTYNDLWVCDIDPTVSATSAQHYFDDETRVSYKAVFTQGTNRVAHFFLTNIGASMTYSQNNQNITTDLSNITIRNDNLYPNVVYQGSIVSRTLFGPSISSRTYSPWGALLLVVTMSYNSTASTLTMQFQIAHVETYNTTTIPGPSYTPTNTPYTFGPLTSISINIYRGVVSYTPATTITWSPLSPIFSQPNSNTLTATVNPISNVNLQNEIYKIVINRLSANRNVGSGTNARTYRIDIGNPTYSNTQHLGNQGSVIFYVGASPLPSPSAQQ